MANPLVPGDAAPMVATRRPSMLSRLTAIAFHPDVPLVGVWLGLGVALSATTYRITDWFKVPDEMVFEHLGISIGRDHSLVPRIHGEFIRSLAQLYPLLISPIVANGYVADDLPQIRVLNAFLVTSACIPAYLLAHRVTGLRWAAYLVGVLSVTLPWLVLSPFLLTEVVALPTFLWAILAIQSAVVRGGARRDLIALAAIALAFFARTQFVLLVVVLPLAVVAYEVPRDGGIGVRDRVAGAARAIVARHRLLAVVSAVAAVAAIVAKLAGVRLLSFSIYGSEFNRGLSLSDVPGWALGHLADLAFSVGILPFLVGCAWLLANLVRPAATKELQAFACVGTSAVVTATYAVTTFDLQIGGYIFDRYLFYLVPLVLLAFTCALLDLRRPRWSLVVPALAVALGFLLHLQASFTWNDVYGRLNTDTPISILYRPIVDLAGGRGGAAALLAGATLALAALFVAASSLLRHGHLLVLLLTLLAIALPVDTGYAFHRLFDRTGYSERPLTQSNAGVLDWIDRKLGPNSSVTIAPYPVSSAYLVTEKYWRDLEFWNKSVTRHVVFPGGGTFNYTGMWFPKLEVEVDPKTGAISPSPTRYVVQSVGETRFRVAGNVLDQRETMLIDAGGSWHAAWRTFGLYDDGWTRPGVTARVRLYPTRGQAVPLVHYLGLQLRTTDDVSSRSVTIVSNHDRRRVDVAAGQTGFVQGLLVCVPAHGFADVRISARGRSTIPGDQTTYDDSLGSRTGGVLVSGIAVADETAGRCGR